MITYLFRDIILFSWVQIRVFFDGCEESDGHVICFAGTLRSGIVKCGGVEKTRNLCEGVVRYILFCKSSRMSKKNIREEYRLWDSFADVSWQHLLTSRHLTTSLKFPRNV